MAKDLSERNPITRWSMLSSNPSVFCENNKCVVCGQVEGDLMFCYESSNVVYYKTRIINTSSDGKNVNYIPITVPKKIIKNEKIGGKWIEAAGIIVTYRQGKNKEKGNSLHLNFCVFEYHIYDNQMEMYESSSANLTYLNGFVCQDAYSMVASKVDFSLVIKNSEDKIIADVPCVVFGEDGMKDAINLKRGQKVGFYGRFQSRFYPKKLPSGETETKIAYEITTRRVFIES